MPPTIQEVVENIVAEMERRAELYDPSQSFWYPRRKDQFPPEAIRELAAYDGGDRVSISCTQTDLPAAAQRKLVDSWCEALPTLRNVRFLWFHSKVLPQMFEAVCRMPSLEGLFVKWSSVVNLQSLPRLPHLKYLYLGSSPGVLSTEPFREMEQLVWLELENLKQISDFSPLAQLSNLKGLGVTGSLWSRQAIDTLSPISRIQSLTWLAVDKASDESLACLANLRSLRWLGLPNRYPMEQFAALAAKLPNTDCTWFRPYSPLQGMLCKKCGQATLVMLTGKGKPTLCTACDAAKLRSHVNDFEKCLQASK